MFLIHTIWEQVTNTTCGHHRALNPDIEGRADSMCQQKNDDATAIAPVVRGWGAGRDLQVDDEIAEEEKRRQQQKDESMGLFGSAFFWSAFPRI
jgi:hypothetical protein